MISNKKRRIIFRADGSGQIGYGHFIRSLALAAYLKNDFECYFATFNSLELFPTHYQLSEIYKVCKYMEIIGNTSDKFNSEFLHKIEPSDIVVLDNYYYTTEYQKSIKNIGCKLVCIDDMHNRHMVCDLLMTASPLKREDFSVEPYTKFIGGIEWAFLRGSFLKRNKDRNVTSEIKSVVIAMGGADPYHLTDKMIKIAHDLLPNSEIHVMAGDTVVISDKSSNASIVHRRLEAGEIVDLFDRSDIGIFPASTVCMEAFSRRLPVIAGYYVDNQEEFYQYGVNHHFFSPLGCLLDDEHSIKERLRNILSCNRPWPVSIDFRRQKGKIIKLFKDLEMK